MSMYVCVFFIILSSVVMPTHFYLKIYLLWITFLFILHITIRTLYMACFAFFSKLYYENKIMVFTNFFSVKCILGLPSSREPGCQCRRHRFDPWWGRTPGGGHGNPLQDSCLENPRDRGAWQATAQRVAKARTWLEQFSTHACKVSIIKLYLV